MSDDFLTELPAIPIPEEASGAGGAGDVVAL
jgi:hypothetical protein